MKNTNGSGRSKAAKDKGDKMATSNHLNTVKSEGPPVKQIQPTAEQLAFNTLIQGKDNADDQEQRQKIKQIIELTGCSQEKAEIALFDSKNDLDGAVGSIFEGATDESVWHESGKKKKKQKSESAALPIEDNMDLKLDQKEGTERIDRENKERNKEEKENDRPFREQSDHRRQRRNDNRPPRLSRGRVRPDWAGDRPERDDDLEREENRERSFSERGRGRGRGGFASRRGGRGGGNFRSRRGGFDKPSQFDNGPQIDTWTNETAVIGEKEPKISNWGDSKDEWNEDIDSWSGSLAESKVFTASANTAQEPQNAVQMDTNAFDMGPLYPKHPQNDMSVVDEHAYITQFNQQATESIKNSIGIGSGPSSSLQNSMTSNVSALVSLQQTALHENLGSSLTSELTGNGLSGSGHSLGRTSLGNSLSNSLPVNSLTGNSLHTTSLSGDLTGSRLVGTSLSGTSMPGTCISVSALTSLAGSPSTATGMSSSSAASHSAMMQQRAKPQKSKLPPPSKIPASAVEMPDHMVSNLDVQFGNLEFGFSVGGNESSPSAFTSSETKSTQSLSNHVGGQGGPVMSKPSESRMSSSLESSPRNSTLYQQSPYTTPTKKGATESPNKINSPPEPLQMPGSTDLKSNQLIQGQAPQVSLPSTNIDAYSYQSQKGSTGYQSASKPGAYPGSQFQTSNPPSQSPSNQFSSQYRQMNQNQFPAGTQFSSVSQYQTPTSAYQSSQSGFQGSQSNYQSNQSQFPASQSQFQNFQSSSTFPNQSSYSSNQSSQNPLYQSSTTSSYTNQSQQNSLYSQSSRQGSYSNQSYLNDHAASAGSTFQASVTQSSSPFKDNQSGASSYRDNMASSKTRDTSADNTSYTRDTNSASSFSDSQSLAYNRDSQSVGSSYSRDSGSAYKRESKSASGSYPRDGSTSDAGSFSRDSQSSSSSFTGRDSQNSTTGFRDNQSGAPGFGAQAGSYPRETGSSQSQSGFSAKSYRNASEVSTTLSNSLTGNKLVEGFSSLAVNDGSLDSRQSTSSQFDVNVSSAKLDVSNTARTSSTTPSSSAVSTTVTSSNTTKISTLHSASTATSTKAPPNLPPGVPIMATQQYILSQAGQMPYFNIPGMQGLQGPMYANLEDFQYLQQRLPPLNSNLYDLTNAAGIQIPATTLTANSTQQSLPTVPTVPYTGSADSTGKVPRVDAQSPTGTMPTSTPSAGQGQGSHQQQQPPFILNYSHYYYPPNMIPGSPGFQFPIIQMPQVTNATHTGTPANSQYQQKSYGSHLQYGATKGYDDLSGPSAADFNKSPYGSSQSQPKPTANSSVTGSVSTDIPLPGGYTKNHTQAFDKQAFHTGTPPPFNLPMAGQLASQTQTGPLGAHTAPYGTPYVPMMAHQPHSQMMHHPIQDASSSSRGSQSVSQSKTSNKGYSAGSNWGSY